MKAFAIWLAITLGVDRRPKEQARYHMPRTVVSEERRVLARCLIERIRGVPIVEHHLHIPEHQRRSHEHFGLGIFLSEHGVVGEGDQFLTTSQIR